ncbi:HAD family phosphatase [Fulvivirga maritima]|uniref:HAD family hydrolase n=1 Tax=Fulvivirga maritima TaxID=2904247 RepID=UPI001F38BD9D|nr:HAD family phosphatase [Fulvivirga maritima]UII27118.1 HAD family phosphatase [Fulvivirga maritima]
MSKKFCAAIFDMDGVIADTNPFHQKSIKQFCQKYDKDVSDEFLKEKVYGRTNEDWIPEVFGKLEHDQLKAYADEKEELFREIYRPELAPVKGIKAFLDHLKRDGIKMAVGTSATVENADFILQGLGIESYFETILHSAHVTKSKPDPQIYLKACHGVGYDPKNCIVFEDSLSGVAAGKAAGCKVVGITTTHTEKELEHCDLIIRDFSMLTPSVLENIM